MGVGVCEAVYTLCSSLCLFYQVLDVGVTVCVTSYTLCFSLCWFYQVLAVGVCEAAYTLRSSLCWFYQVLAVGVAGIGTAPVSNQTLRRVSSPPQATNKDDC